MTEEEIMDTLNNEKVKFDLIFVARLMKLLEIADVELSGLNGGNWTTETLIEYSETLGNNLFSKVPQEEFNKVEDVLDI